MTLGMLGLLYSQLFLSLPKPTTSCAGKTIIITGSNTGLGKEAARHFARLGASTIILAVRSVSKGEAAKANIEASTHCSPSVIQVWDLDMESYSSVLAFASRVEAELPRLDISLLNAGTAKQTFSLAENDESNITVNVVSTFLLALLLLPKMKATAKQYNTRPTLTIVSSEVHAWAQFEERHAPEGGIFKRLAQPTVDGKPIDFNERYQVTKLLDVLCTRALCDRAPASKIPVTINTVNPGLCQSELSREMGWSFELMKLLIARTTAYGARTFVHAALQGAETHGAYMSDCQVEEPSAWVRSPEGKEVQERVWRELERKLEAIRPGVAGNL